MMISFEPVLFSMSNNASSRPAVFPGEKAPDQAVGLAKPLWIGSGVKVPTNSGAAVSLGWIVAVGSGVWVGAGVLLGCAVSVPAIIVPERAATVACKSGVGVGAAGGVAQAVKIKTKTMNKPDLFQITLLKVKNLRLHCKNLLP